MGKTLTERLAQGEKILQWIRRLNEPDPGKALEHFEHYVQKGLHGRLNYEYRKDTKTPWWKWWKKKDVLVVRQQEVEFLFVRKGLGNWRSNAFAAAL